ncbi:universal stress protein [Streptomyces sp. NPDC088253]|uniref:universal stress protein n=1 Tax=Streptomyces sp. NPDC088253 TaxID=3365846 RepID=UPI003820C53F
MTTRHVTVGVDGSLVAVQALDRASEEALLRGAVLDIVYAVPDLDEAGPILASAVSRVCDRHPGLPVTARAVEGGPVQALVRHGREAELTVVGTCGLGSVAGLLFRSVSLRLAAHTYGPLLIVRGDRRTTSRGEVLLGLESNTDADAAVFAFAEVARRGARLRVLDARPRHHLAPELPSPAHAREVENDGARHVRLAVAGPGQQHEGGARAFRNGPATELLEATREAAVVVVGACREPHRLGRQLSTVTHAVLNHSHCPVVVVPTGAGWPRWGENPQTLRRG